MTLFFDGFSCSRDGKVKDNSCQIPLQPHRRSMVCVSKIQHKHRASESSRKRKPWMGGCDLLWCTVSTGWVGKGCCTCLTTVRAQRMVKDSCKTALIGGYTVHQVTCQSHIVLSPSQRFLWLISCISINSILRSQKRRTQIPSQKRLQWGRGL